MCDVSVDGNPFEQVLVFKYLRLVLEESHTNGDLMKMVSGMKVTLHVMKGIKDFVYKSAACVSVCVCFNI